MSCLLWIDGKSVLYWSFLLSMIYTVILVVSVVGENSFPRWDSVDPVLGSTVTLEQGDLILMMTMALIMMVLLPLPDWSYGSWSQAFVSVHHG